MLAARLPHLSWPALLIAYAATLVVFWWVPMSGASRMRAEPRIGSGDENPKGP
jgi:hypothetical protein